MCKLVNTGELTEETRSDLDQECSPKASCAHRWVLWKVIGSWGAALLNGIINWSVEQVSVPLKSGAWLEEGGNLERVDLTRWLLPSLFASWAP